MCGGVLVNQVKHVWKELHAEPCCHDGRGVDRSPLYYRTPLKSQSLHCLESQVAQNYRPLYPKIAHSPLKVALIMGHWLSR